MSKLNLTFECDSQVDIAALNVCNNIVKMINNGITSDYHQQNCQAKVDFGHSILQYITENKDDIANFVTALFPKAKPIVMMIEKFAKPSEIEDEQPDNAESEQQDKE